MEEKIARYNKASSLRRKARVSAAKRFKQLEEVLVDQEDETIHTELNEKSTESDIGTDLTSDNVVQDSHQLFTESYDVKWDDTYSLYSHDLGSDSEETCSDGSDTDDYDTELELEHRIAKWSLRYSVSMAALSALLTLLQPHHKSLPKDARTLLKTNRDMLVHKRAGGCYFYQGIVAPLKNTFLRVHKHFKDHHTFNLQLNIDGLPLFRSCDIQFWPVLGMLQGIGMKEPVVITLYCGSKKPSSLEEYLNDLVNEINTVKKGFQFLGKTFYIKISSIMCDAPARAFVKGIKSHTGYNACDKCIQTGEYINHRMTFPESRNTLRTDQSFRLQSDEDHHTCKSPFVDTYIGMVSQFPHDYMHLVCLGVMRRLLNFWMKGPLQCRLPSFMVQSLSDKLTEMKSFIPTEFGRKPRPLHELAHWKATEFRQFLLYTGPVVLQGILEEPVYQNFILLFIGIYILCSPKLCTQYRDYAHKLLVLFTEHFGQIYGKQYIGYNIHGLIHLSDDVEVHGHLDMFSCFPFESYLGKLKKLVRKPNFPLEQVIRRLSEYNAQNMGTYSSVTSVEAKICTFKKPYKNGPITHELGNVENQFKELFFTDFCLKVSGGDNCVAIGQNIVLIRNIVTLINGQTYVVYENFRSQSPFFDYPLKSSNLGIFLLKSLSGTLRYCSLDKISQKYVLLPSHDGHVGIPLLHVQ